MCIQKLLISYLVYPWENNLSGLEKVERDLKVKGRKLLLVTGTPTPSNLISVPFEYGKSVYPLDSYMFLNLLYLFHHEGEAQDFSHLALNYTY